MRDLLEDKDRKQCQKDRFQLNPIKYHVEKLDIAAERFTLKRGVRSARVAKQFVDAIVAESSENVI